MTTDSDLAHLEFRNAVESFHEDIDEIKAALRELTAAVTKLALIEQQIAYGAKAQERAFTALEKLEGRVAGLEQTALISKRAADWVDRGMWVAAAAAAMFVAKQTGLL